MTPPEAREYFLRQGTDSQSGRAGAALIAEIDRLDANRLADLERNLEARDATIESVTRRADQYFKSWIVSKRERDEAELRALAVDGQLNLLVEENRKLAQQIKEAEDPPELKAYRHLVLSDLRAELGGPTKSFPVRRYKQGLLRALDKWVSDRLWAPK